MIRIMNRAASQKPHQVVRFSFLPLTSPSLETSGLTGCSGYTPSLGGSGRTQSSPSTSCFVGREGLVARSLAGFWGQTTLGSPQRSDAVWTLWVSGLPHSKLRLVSSRLFQTGVPPLKWPLAFQSCVLRTGLQWCTGHQNIPGLLP